MLDEKDLRAIASLMDEKISAAESRMMTHVDEKIGAAESRMMTHVDEKIGAAESRMMTHVDEKISAAESRMMTHVDEKTGAAESRMMAMMEAYFEPKFSLLAEQIDLILEKLIPAETLEHVEDRVDVLEVVVKQHSQEIAQLKKAQ